MRYRALEMSVNARWRVSLCVCVCVGVLTGSSHASKIERAPNIPLKGGRVSTRFQKNIVMGPIIVLKGRRVRFKNISMIDVFGSDDIL